MPPADPAAPAEDFPRLWRTERLILRPAGPQDLDFACALFSAPRMLAHRPDPTPPTRARLAEEMAQAEAGWARHGLGRWRLTLSEDPDGQPAGFAGLSPRDGRTGLSISYHIHPDLQGRGLAGEFVAAALARAFAPPLSAPRVFGLVRPANPASRRVLVRAGFVSQGLVPYGGAPTELLVRTP